MIQQPDGIVSNATNDTKLQVQLHEKKLQKTFNKIYANFFLLITYLSIKILQYLRTTKTKS